jgi:hypothetical protein
MGYNNSNDTEFYNEIQRKRNLNAIRREKLIKEGKPLVDYSLPRLL